ncbi:hypothetical protein I3843_04G135400 [Carya illinoinensis]|uniref:Protein BIG GRAIN 1-like B n=1 Tax=Carya illinoinensis TaxID=32201 RepID=A0A8T1QUP5_CARIL|nr:protein BIG GRAIN 1-like C [Carya illinoinensis]KAG6658237.1 hypothetical protein CIPAW_04G146700 [Carya illinoinensis]KAG7984012.1 hypothetical protein I3843_04G135400 [Carya illinoinensis]
MYGRERSPREYSFPQRRRTPSFSSTLLDVISRSIDEPNAAEAHFKETTAFKKQSISSSKRGSWVQEEDREVKNLRRSVMIEDWMEKQSIHSSVLFNSTSSSSESSSGAGFSSSETESFYKHKPKPKLQSSKKQTKLEYRNSEKHPKSKSEGSSAKLKLQGLKMHGELKKAKQPISPGGRIASFLNSIFNSDNVKKAKMCYVGAVEDVNFEPKSKSACSSRSCLSKTPASRGKLSNGIKRSVKFYPLSVIVGEDSQPCGHKCIYEDDPSLMTIPTIRKISKTRSVKKVTTAFDLRGLGHREVDDDDDAESYSSSDLFELDHLVGIGRYREELPVYETTNLKTNQAIANGLIF